MDSIIKNRRFYLLLVTALILRTCSAANFTQCRIDVETALTKNGTIELDTNGTVTDGPWPDPVYHGVIRGLHTGIKRPLTLTLQGCKDACGTGAQPLDVDSAFQILTTWVLPVIALLSSVPYESNNNGKNLEAFMNWFGAPAAALTTTIWNILMTRKCHKLSERDPMKVMVARDCLFILSCVNQYEYPRRGAFKSARRLSTAASRAATFYSENLDRRRDKALLRGVLFPYLNHPALAPGQPLRLKLENLNRHLAFQLRLQRRRGVFPLALSIVWFLFAFVVSIVTAFAQLGDNTTAHSLALGLLLSWMPIIVVACIIDRNPVSATRCGILIERWLYNVDALFNEAQLTPAGVMFAGYQMQRERSNEHLIPQQISPQMLPQSYIRRKPVKSAGGQQYLSVPSAAAPDIDEGEMYEMRARSLSDASVDMVDLVGGSTTGIDKPDHADNATLRSVSTTATSNNINNSNADPIMRTITNTTTRSTNNYNGIIGKQWRQGDNTSYFTIKDFVGQGRILRYCAVSDTVLALFEQNQLNTSDFLSDEDADKFKQLLPLRPWLWYVTWLLSQFLVTMAFSMALMVSFNTPTIGLGCRSLSYIIWYTLSLVSWIALLFWQEPPRLVRYATWLPNLLAVISLFTVMGLQMTGGLKRCICKVSIFGSSAYGGYMDFQNGEFYQGAYDVKNIWAISTAFGLSSCTVAISWFYRRWSRDTSLWRVHEDFEPEVIDGVDLVWLT